MTPTGLYIVGDETSIDALRELALEAGLTAMLVRPKAQRKAIPSPTQSAIHRRRAVLPKSETRLGKLVLEIMRSAPLKVWDTEEIAIAIEEQGYRWSSASPILCGLRHEGWVVRWQGQPKHWALTALGRGDVTIGRTGA